MIASEFFKMGFLASSIILGEGLMNVGFTYISMNYTLFPLSVDNWLCKDSTVEYRDVIVEWRSSTIDISRCVAPKELIKICSKLRPWMA